MLPPSVGASLSSFHEVPCLPKIIPQSFLQATAFPFYPLGVLASSPALIHGPLPTSSIYPSSGHFTRGQEGRTTVFGEDEHERVKGGDI